VGAVDQPEQFAPPIKRRVHSGHCGISRSLVVFAVDALRNGDGYVLLRHDGKWLVLKDME
jgi:hypothetical protein